HSSCAIVIGHWQNPVPGLVSRITTEAHMPHKRFFLCVKRTYSMVGCVGAPKGAPGSFVAGKTNSAQFTTI
ncbi:ash family protein, partial [Escherichia coli]|nr:ash family protein [Escherichia coli]MBB9428339.1 ash family protein [Escherichia coli]